MGLYKNRALWTLTLGHFSVDLYGGTLPIILLLMTDQLGLSYTQVGLVSTAFIAAASLTQPLFGYLADRFGGRLLGVGGVIWIALMTGTMGFAPSFHVLLLLAPLAGLGSAAFHPHGAASAAVLSGEQRATGMSIFMIGGNAGFALGPLLAGTVFAAVGVQGTALLTSIALVLGPILYLATSRSVIRAPADPGDDSQEKPRNTEIAFLGIIVLMALIFFRSWSNYSVVTYLPQFFKAAGMPVTFASNLLTAVLLPRALGSVIGGFLADRVDRRRVVFVSLLLAVGFSRLLLATTDWMAFLVAPLAGVAIGASVPVTLVMAQEMLPRGLGLVTGLILGFTFISSGIGASLTGFLADRWGIVATMELVIWLPLISAALSFLLPLPREVTAEPHRLAESTQPSR